MVKKRVEENQDFTRIKNFFYSLYETEEELSRWDADDTLEVISGQEADFIESLELKKELLENSIKQLLEKTIKYD